MALKRFVESYTKSTGMGYRSGVVAFLNHIYRLNDKEVAAEKYINENRNYAHDITSFIAAEEKRGIAPKTIRLYVVGVKEFLYFYEKDISSLQLRTIRRRTPRARNVSVEKLPTHEEISQILSHAPLMLRTIILLSVSSGMRISEILSISKNDITILESHVGKIVIKPQYTKTKRGRTVYCSAESISNLNEWLKIRLKHVKTHSQKARNFGSTPTKVGDRIFPYTKSAVEHQLVRALQRASLHTVDPTTGRSVIHFHSFRKYFATNSKDAGMHDMYVEMLLGHYNDTKSAYQIPTENQIQLAYEKIEPYLTIGVHVEIVKESKKQSEEITNLKLQIAKMEGMIKSLANVIVHEAGEPGDTPEEIISLISV